MSVIYSSDSKVVMPMYPKTMTGTKSQSDAAKACSEVDEGQYRLPNIEELMSIYYNSNLFGGNSTLFGSSAWVWSSTSVDSTTAYTMGNSRGIKYPLSKTSRYGFVCVER